MFSVANGSLLDAVVERAPERVRALMRQGADAHEGVYPHRDATSSDDESLCDCAGAANYERAEMLLRRGANPNAQVPASGSPMFQAYSEADWKMVELLAGHGGVPEATTAGLFRQTELARKMLAGEAAYRLDGVGGDTLAEQLLWGGACGGDPEIVRMALARVNWDQKDPRWFAILEQPLRIWTHGSASANWDRGTYLVCFPSPPCCSTPVPDSTSATTC